MTVTRWFVISVAFFVALTLIYGTEDPYLPWAEWVYCYLLVNYFAILSYDNEFYDCVASYSKDD